MSVSWWTQRSFHLGKHTQGRTVASKLARGLLRRSRQSPYQPLTWLHFFPCPCPPSHASYPVHPFLVPHPSGRGALGQQGFCVFPAQQTPQVPTLLAESRCFKNTCRPTKLLHSLQHAGARGNLSAGPLAPSSFWGPVHSPRLPSIIPIQSLAPAAN